MTYYDCLESPLGTLVLTADGICLTGVHFPGAQGRPVVAEGWERADDLLPLRDAKRQLGDYFAGQRREFELPLAPNGTSFQRRVWEELQRIPFGTTISYGDLAQRIGNPSASRAVGLANGRNPIAIVVPCHRVIGANGRLVGYGGGLPIKEALLDFETRVRATGPQPFPRDGAE